LFAPTSSSEDSSRIFASMPGSGVPADPGFMYCAPGSVVIMIWPVSVCHQVSTTGVSPRPMTSRYQSQAFGLIGSPTVPRSRSDERSCLAGSSAPHFMNDRIAVGAK
jgi:hypothetical protein